MKRKLSPGDALLRALMIWALTNSLGTIVMLVVVVINTGFIGAIGIMYMGAVGGVITIPVMIVLLPMLYALQHVRTTWGRVVFVIFAMTVISCGTGLLITWCIDGNISRRELETMSLMLTPWILSSIGVTLFAARDIIFIRKNNNNTSSNSYYGL